MQLTKRHARKVLEVVDAGLSAGLGDNEPGKMCVEAAVCFALGLPHGDDPPCVGAAVRAFKISLNDNCGLDSAGRAKLLRRLAVSQLGSDTIDQSKFSALLAEKTTRRILPIVLRAAAKVQPQKEHADRLLAVASRCETEGTEAATRAAARAAADAANATDAARAAANAARAATDAARAAADAANATYATYATYAARAAADATYAARAAANARKEIFELAAEIGVEALQECGSPGCKWLDLCEGEPRCPTP